MGQMQFHFGNDIFAYTEVSTLYVGYHVSTYESGVLLPRRALQVHPGRHRRLQCQRPPYRERVASASSDGQRWERSRARKERAK